jgi:hypothetical protein
MKTVAQYFSPSQLNKYASYKRVRCVVSFANISQSPRIPNHADAIAKFQYKKKEQKFQMRLFFRLSNFECSWGRDIIRGNIKMSKSCVKL